MRYDMRRRTRADHSGSSFWLSFSDLMSALLLVFLLVMFYSVYQYLDMLEIKTAELTRQSGLLDEKQAELTAKDEQLKASQEKLSESEQALVTQQAKLLLSEKNLNSSQALLDSQKEELEKKNALLASQQAALDEARTLLDDQQADLDNAQILLASQQADMDSARELLEQQQNQLQLQQQKLDDLVGVRARIISSLAQAMQKAGIRAAVDPNDGSITLDASVLFDVNMSELKESGKAALDQFLPVYLSVLMDSENSPNISEIIIEGHTDTDGTYMNNLKLSQERALSVMEYVLGDDYRMITGGMKRRLREIATANGRSYSNPVRNDDGSVNKTASRRVEFKFRLQDEQMIEDMRALLENME